jgi:hypothetical protein
MMFSQGTQMVGSEGVAPPESGDNWFTANPALVRYNHPKIISPRCEGTVFITPKKAEVVKTTSKTLTTHGSRVK